MWAEISGAFTTKEVFAEAVTKGKKGSFGSKYDRGKGSSNRRRSIGETAIDSGKKTSCVIQTSLNTNTGLGKEKVKVHPLLLVKRS